MVKDQNYSSGIDAILTGLNNHVTMARSGLLLYINTDLNDKERSRSKQACGTETMNGTRSSLPQLTIPNHNLLGLSLVTQPAHDFH